MTLSLEPFKRAIVRIMDDGGQLHGMGILVSSERILTCAHVVGDALGVPSDITNAPPGIVKINLPFLDGAPPLVCARVLPDSGWYPSKKGNGLDLALLEPVLPLTADGYFHISSAFSLFGLRFTSWAAQEGHEHDLVPIRGRLEQEIANGRYVVNVRESNYRIRAGCSGAPVIDATNGLILGLIAQEELNEAAAEIGRAHV